MGVVNLSSQSWYRESVCLSLEAALRRGRILQAQGADLVDVGGESSLSHARRTGVREQIAGLVPVVKGLAREGTTVSVETYRVEVARAALDAGARLINMTGCGESEAIYRMAAQGEAGVIVSYVQGENVREVDRLEFDGDPAPVIREYFRREIGKAREAGLERLVLDPGLGFYYRNLEDGRQRVDHQMRMLLRSGSLGTDGWPVCNALPHAFEFFREEVCAAESFFAVLAALGGTALFRTHEVSRVGAVLRTLACLSEDGQHAPLR